MKKTKLKRKSRKALSRPVITVCHNMRNVLNLSGPRNREGRKGRKGRQGGGKRNGDRNPRVQNPGGIKRLRSSRGLKG